VSINILDVLAILYLILAVVDGWRKGVYTLFNILALVLSGLFAKFWYGFMLSFLNSAFGFESSIAKYVSDLVQANPQNLKLFAQFLGMQTDITVQVADVSHKIAVLLAMALSFIAAYIILRIIFLFFSGKASEMLSMKLFGVLVHLIIAVVVITIVFDILWALSFQIEGLRNLMLTSKIWPLASYINALLLSLI
jgi:hypothetical protein